MEVMSSKAVVAVEDLCKVFRVPVREAGLKASLSSLFHRETREIEAVDEVSFTVQPGEMVGFLGPNGAGKTTTLKMLSGLLHPTSGRCEVLGYEPRTRPAGLLRQITLVMGNRNQLQWDLPALDSFELGTLVTKPVRNLSLGERMKMEIAGSLLHRPKVLFLDEPTIGLDITMQKRIRTFIAEYNVRYGATVMLTSHYMADVQALCKRVVVIHHGSILFDGELAALASKFSLDKTVTARLADGDEVKVKAPRGDIAAATGRLLAEHDVVDLTIEDAPIEDVIELLFTAEPRS
jgi:ABC-2 type transport system ATP-binding protein